MGFVGVKKHLEISAAFPLTIAIITITQRNDANSPKQ